MSKRLIFALVCLWQADICLAAVINLGDECINPNGPGNWRKRLEHRYQTPYGSESSSYYTWYYYNQAIPTRLDSVKTGGSTGPYNSGAVDRYFYNSYPAYEEEVIEIWSYFCDSGLVLERIFTTRYDLEGKKFEYLVSNDQGFVINRIAYTYDAHGNLSSETEYRSNYDPVQPYQIIIHTYDSQNRLIYTNWNREGQSISNRWQSWSSHTLPDSIYIDQSTSPVVVIWKNQFDYRGELVLQSKITKDHSYSSWYRKDSSFSYLIWNEMLFPEQTVIESGYIAAPDAPFTPTNTSTISYNYSNNYHSVNFYWGGHYGYTYDDNWLLTAHTENNDYGNLSETITWESYDPVPVHDGCAPALRLDIWPNPAQDLLIIKMDRQDAPTVSGARVFNLKGQLVRGLDSPERAGNQMRYSWDCRDESGRDVPNGIYLIKIETPGGTFTRRISVLK